MKDKHQFRTNQAIANYSHFRDLWDTPLFESPSFVAVPTVGALVEGWLLVVPKQPALSFGLLPIEAFREFEEFLKRVVACVESQYGPVAIFEHGSSQKTSCIGCGVDYAHMHLVPTKYDLLGGAKQIAPDIDWKRIASIRDIRYHANGPDGYWFLQQASGKLPMYIGTCPHGSPTSQLFRKVIAMHVGCPSQFDWKFQLGEALIAATIDKLSKVRVPV